MDRQSLSGPLAGSSLAAGGGRALAGAARQKEVQYHLQQVHGVLLNATRNRADLCNQDFVGGWHHASLPMSWRSCFDVTASGQVAAMRSIVLDAVDVLQQRRQRRGLDPPQGGCGQTDVPLQIRQVIEIIEGVTNQLRRWFSCICRSGVVHGRRDAPNAMTVFVSDQKQKARPIGRPLDCR